MPLILTFHVFGACFTTLAVILVSLTVNLTPLQLILFGWMAEYELADFSLSCTRVGIDNNE